ncbi:hypothetical protein E3J49_03895 [Candidatus Bathyarchaeota archaeon]|nr:MAG: hypothetical protein E3J49_03895 [Candidatus Bathyarchaeota archaeon]
MNSGRIRKDGNWLVGKKFFLKHGFESVDQYPPFELTVKKFNDAPSPSFSGEFEERLRAYGKGLTIIRSDQCLYVDAAVRAALNTTKELGIRAKMVELKSFEDVRRLSPSPYGVFGIVCDGKLVSYHNVAKKELMNILGNLSSS